MQFLIRYGYRFCRTLTLQKIKNALLLFLQFYISVLTKKTRISAKPVTLSIEPTNNCNLFCPECLTGSKKMERKKGKILPDDFNLIIDQVYSELCYLLLYFQGEPFLHPRFIDFVRHAKSKGIFVASSTNGHFLSETNVKGLVLSKLDFLTISLDGVTPESYQRYRKGGDFNQVISGIKTLAKIKKELKTNYPLVELQFIVFKHNERETKRFQELGKQLGADRISIKSAQINNTGQSSEILPPDNPVYSRYKKGASGNFYLIKKKRKYCPRQWCGAVITWDGNMAPCCYDKEAKYAYGNLKENRLDELWKNPKAMQFREIFFQQRNVPEICKECSEISI
ncbi:MAG: radical SAM protein [Prevotellaceae bacterium]|jgi:radical SAM protein with 4Fe4S-binding SPASM domain|nr:radical SAM protein [Prevotellaceae bacterium]